jgi:hypothetical protein
MNCLKLDIELPNNFEKYEESIQKSIHEYLSQLDSIEKKAYVIAKSHLGSSFNLVKSNGYINWKKTKL